ncbi:MAG: hypothetical protein BIFFINMI_01597 [Phycisphaerae bacterium]|nr:hypothetical protein [Phycisphaerae bacterium]
MPLDSAPLFALILLIVLAVCHSLLGWRWIVGLAVAWAAVLAAIYLLSWPAWVAIAIQAGLIIFTILIAIGQDVWIRPPGMR